MHAPATTCRALYDLDPTLRLCWLGFTFTAVGRLPETAPEDERGCFGVLQIMPRRVAGHPGPGRSNVVAPHVEELQYLGETFTRDGMPGRDWDPVTQAAVLIRTCDFQWDLSHADVFGTGLLAHMRAMQGRKADIKAAEAKVLAQLERDKRSRLDNVKSAMAEGLTYERKRTDSPIRVVEARKHAKQELEEARKRAAPAFSATRKRA